MSSTLLQPQILNKKKSISPAKVPQRERQNSRKVKKISNITSISSTSTRVASISPLRTKSGARDRKNSQKKVKGRAAPVSGESEKNKILDVQRIFTQNQNSLHVLQIPQFSDQIYDQQSLDDFIASNNVIHPQTLERIQALVDLEKNMNSLEVVLQQKDKQIASLQDELKRKLGYSDRDSSPTIKHPSIQVTRSSPERDFLRSRVDSGAGAALMTESSPYGVQPLVNHAKTQSLGAQQEQHGRQPSHERFSSNFDYQLNYLKQQNEKLKRQLHQDKKTIKNYEAAVQTIMKQSKEKEKEQKAKSKIISQYLEQTKQDHAIEIEELRNQIDELQKLGPVTVPRPVRTEPTSGSKVDKPPVYEIKEKVIEKVVEKVVEDTSKIKRMNTTIFDQESRINDQESRLIDQEQEIQELNDELVSMKEQYNEMRRIIEFDAEAKATKAAEAKMSREKNKIKEMCMFEAKTQLKGKFQEEKDAIESKFKAGIESHKQQIERLRSDLRAKTRELEQVHDHLLKTESELKKQTELKRAESRRYSDISSSSAPKAAELAATNKKVAELQKELDLARKQIREAEEERMQEMLHKQQEASQRQMRRESRKTVQKKASTPKRQEKGEEKLSKAMGAINIGRLQSEQTQNTEMSESESECGKTRKELKKENQEFEDKMDEMQKELDEANDELEDRDDQIEYLKADVEAGKTEIKNLKNQVQDFNKINDMVVKLTLDLKEAETAKNAAQKSLQNANFENRQLISQIANLEEQIEVLQKKLDSQPIQPYPNDTSPLRLQTSFDDGIETLEINVMGHQYASVSPMAIPDKIVQFEDNNITPTSANNLSQNYGSNRRSDNEKGGGQQLDDISDLVAMNNDSSGFLGSLVAIKKQVSKSKDEQVKETKKMAANIKNQTIAEEISYQSEDDDSDDSDSDSNSESGGEKFKSAVQSPGTQSPVHCFA